MNADNLKFSLIDKIISIRDKSLLERINALIGNVDLENPVFKVSDRQRQMLKKSEDDIIKGNLISDEDVNKEEDKWLNE